MYRIKKFVPLFRYSKTRVLPKYVLALQTNKFHLQTFLRNQKKEDEYDDEFFEHEPYEDEYDDEFYDYPEIDRNYEIQDIMERHQSIFEIRDAIVKGEITCEEIVREALERAKTTELNPFITLCEDAIEQAREADKRRANGKSKGVFDGIPISIKDSFCTKGIRTTMGSKMLQNYIPPYDATVVSRLKEEGAIIIGKTNLDEFAMGSGTTFSAFGETLNLWSNTDGEYCIPGGSSGGSAVSVATQMAFISLGSDTGGSVRQPASHCGVVGFKPTYGLCSRYGLISFASSLDTVGIFSRASEDAAAVLDVIGGPDPNDSSCRREPTPNFYERTVTTKDLKGIKIGIPIEYYVEELSDETVQVWSESIKLLRELGAEVHYVSLPHTKYALPAYYVIAPAEASSNLARFDGIRYGYSSKNVNSLEDVYFNSRSEGFGEEVKRRIVAGTFSLSVDNYESHFKKAQQVRRLVAKDFEDVFNQGFHLIFTPTVPTTAPTIQKFKELTPVEKYLEDVFTIPCSLAGLPAISVPACFSQNGLPMGVQFISRPMGDEYVLKAAYMYESIGKKNHDITEFFEEVVDEDENEEIAEIEETKK